MYILAIDQGTTGTTTIVYNREGGIMAKAYREFPQYYPNPGWVEHNPLEIWQTVVDTVEEIMHDFQGKIEAIGITNQRETTLLWNKHTGEPIYNAIVWQCRRTADLCNAFKDEESQIYYKTGLPLDPYFSGSKIRWLLDNVQIDNINDIFFGTIDSWLIYKLTGGQVHATDFTNASRTLLYNIEEKKWDHDLLNLFGIPDCILPTVESSIHHFGDASSIDAIKGLPILSVAGDQQAALFGQACYEYGQAKNTYGTGSFFVMNTGDKFVHSKNGLLTTLAVDGKGNPCYALEGSIFIAGAAIQWLRDELQVLSNASESEQMAMSVKDNFGVYFVPAFAGLGAPHWDSKARGAIVGLTGGANKNHITRAALEAMSYQSYDILNIMETEAEREIEFLAVDGGAVANNFLMQFQADIINRPVLRPKVIESTSLGVAMMAGLESGMFNDYHELELMKQLDQAFEPAMDQNQREYLIEGWHKALRQVIV